MESELDNLGCFIGLNNNVLRWLLLKFKGLWDILYSVRLKELLFKWLNGKKDFKCDLLVIIVVVKFS